jgi:hypothetical protein
MIDGGCAIPQLPDLLGDAHFLEDVVDARLDIQ